jgi:hypothetical protein
MIETDQYYNSNNTLKSHYIINMIMRQAQPVSFFCQHGPPKEEKKKGP